jgi:hypothetical protein
MRIRPFHDGFCDRKGNPILVLGGLRDLILRSIMVVLAKA